MKQGIILFFSLLVLVLSLTSAQTAYNCLMGGYGNMMYGGYGTGAILISWLIGVLFVIALVLAIIWLTKQIGKK